MDNPQNPKSVSLKRPSIGRHKLLCGVCAHPQRNEIEREFLSWASPAQIAVAYGLGHRATIYRHAHALNLDQKRNRNLCCALERLVERVDEVEKVNASAIIKAVAVLAEITAKKQFEEPDDVDTRSELFECMNLEEFERYARNGTLPDWYKPREEPADSNGSEGGDNA